MERSEGDQVWNHEEARENAKLQIYTLGSMKLVLNGQELTGFASYKAPLLLIYLTVTKQAIARATLAELFYPITFREQARANLRAVLNNLKVKGLEDFISISRNSISVARAEDIWIDSLDLEKLLESDALESAVALYAGDFLDRIALDIVKEKECVGEWIITHRRWLRLLIMAALDTLTERCLVARDFQHGLQYGSRLLTLEPTHEKAHLQTMQILAMMGCVEEALLQYERCCALLARRNLLPSQALLDAYSVIARQR